MLATPIPARRSRPPQPMSAAREASHESPPATGVRREESFDSRTRVTTVCPETELMYAVLEDAFACFQKRDDGARPGNQRPAWEAEIWFFANDPSWLYSFVSICDVLGLDPMYIRKKLRPSTPPRLGQSAGKEIMSSQ